MDRDGVRCEPALEERAELDHPKDERHEDDDHERGLEGGETTLITPNAHRTVCSWVTRAWRRETSPLFQADTPVTRVPRTTAAPMMYSIVARPSRSRMKRRSPDMGTSRWWSAHRRARAPRGRCPDD